MAASAERETKRRVVVTGIGGLCAVGNSATEIWDSIAAGISGIGPITRFDPDKSWNKTEPDSL